MHLNYLVDATSVLKVFGLKFNFTSYKLSLSVCVEMLRKKLFLIILTTQIDFLQILEPMNYLSKHSFTMSFLAFKVAGITKNWAKHPF